MKKKNMDPRPGGEGDGRPPSGGRVDLGLLDASFGPWLAHFVLGDQKPMTVEEEARRYRQIVGYLNRKLSPAVTLALVRKACFGLPSLHPKGGRKK